MKRIFLDINFLIDYLLRDEYKVQSRKFLEEGIRCNCKFYVSFLSVANFAYIARKLPKNELHKYISTICELFEIAENNGTHIIKSLSLQSSDFEDSLQDEAAMEYGCEAIITRNEKDFKFSKITVCSSEEYSKNNFFI